MSTASHELHQHVFKTLLSDTALMGLLGGEKVFDRVPERVAPPYVVMGQMSDTDWSTSTEDGKTISFTLHAWSKHRSREESHAILAQIEQALTEAAVTLPGHHLVSLRTLFSEVRRDAPSKNLHGIIRLRAVCEPLV